MQELKYWVAFHRISGLGPVRFNMLERHFGSLEEAWLSDRKSLRAAGISHNLVNEICKMRGNTDPDEQMEDLKRRGITAIHLRSDKYPELLAETPDAPTVLYAKGEIHARDNGGIAVIGSRAATRYGRQMCETLSGGLASLGITVVSGLARGIDSIAHRSTLEAGGRTIAVLAGGLDYIYPSENLGLSRDIAGNGCLLTEYPVGMRSRKEHFPRRNRVISGLCRGVVVVEAAMKSGAMLTVRWALEQGREVFAVPGNATSPKSAGTNWLIQQGAKLTSSVDDILDELSTFYDLDEMSTRHEGVSTATQIVETNSPETGIDGSTKPKPRPVMIETHSKTEEDIVAILSTASKPVHVDEIVRKARISVDSANSALTMMEVRGIVRCVEGTLFELIPAKPLAVATRLMDESNSIL